ncbi:hypothetical protein CERZMDRAFT_118887 [Cercospora zeae-maydis SCOH1-5]|uniref:Uncharacterized protein n=1 Tax=Cercospora zeae-maydis SCOH1-5 TaxID=717836 RepID=A0A6A6F0L7_9PEZI|nr:hypothetical protein CERZMDRAFT_118887 [Cercospora zeae-maydis SCOH1-5]
MARVYHSPQEPAPTRSTEATGSKPRPRRMRFSGDDEANVCRRRTGRTTTELKPRGEQQQNSRPPPREVLERYRQLWLDRSADDNGASANQLHAGYQAANDAFVILYCTPSTTDKDLRSQIGIINSTKFEWHQELEGPRLYAVFGQDAFTRSFLKHLRDFARLRQRVSIGNAEDTGLSPLAFEKALELLMSARAHRISGAQYVRGTSQAAGWQPLDCRRAANMAVERLGALLPEQANHQSRRLPDITPQTAEAHENAGTADEDEPSGTAPSHDESNHNTPTTESEVDRTIQSDHDAEDNCAQQGDTGTEGSVATPERGRQAPTTPRHSACSDASTRLPSFPSSPASSFAHFDAQTSHAGLDTFDDFQLPTAPATLDNHRNSYGLGAMPRPERKKLCRRASPTPIDHGHGHISRFKRTRIDRNALDVAVPRDFLGHFVSPPYILHEQPSRSGTADTSTLVVHNVTLQTSSASAPLHAIALIAPPGDIQAGEDDAQQTSVADGTGDEATAWRSAKSWMLAEVGLDNDEFSVELFSTALELSSQARDHAHRVLRSALPPTLSEKLQGHPAAASSYNHPQHVLDVRDEDPQGLVQCVAAAVCLITATDVPEDIHVWAWVGAMAAVTSYSSRTSDFLDFVEMPCLPDKASTSRVSAADSPKATFQFEATVTDGHRIFLSEIALLRDQTHALGNYIRHLQSIRECSQSAMTMSVPHLEAAAITKLDEKIRAWQDMLDRLSPIDDAEEYSVVRTQLEDAKQKRSAAGHNSSKMLAALKAWANQSIGEADAFQLRLLKRCDAMMERFAQQGRAVLVEAQSLVAEARSRDCSL